MTKMISAFFQINHPVTRDAIIPEAPASNVLNRTLEMRSSKAPAKDSRLSESMACKAANSSPVSSNPARAWSGSVNRDWRNLASTTALPMMACTASFDMGFTSSTVLLLL